MKTSFLKKFVVCSMVMFFVMGFTTQSNFALAQTNDPLGTLMTQLAEIDEALAVTDEFYGASNLNNLNEQELRNYVTDKGNELRERASILQQMLVLSPNNESVLLQLESTQAQLRELSELYNPTSNPDSQVDPRQSISNRVSPPKPESCGFFSSFSCFLRSGISYVGEFLKQILGLVLWGVGGLFDYAVQYSVVNFGSLANSPAVNGAWQVLRDVSNLFFIFILLYAAIGMILQVSSINGRQILVSVIVIALLINFSAFFTRIIIDASNVVAYQFYKAVSLDKETYAVAFGSGSVRGLSAVFMNALPLTTWIGKAGTAGFIPAAGVGWEFVNSSVVAFGTIVMMVITIFVFIAATVLFAHRVVSLVLAIILSPLAFLAYALPNQKGQFDKWFHTLLDQAFFAPLYLIMIYLTIVVLKSDALAAILTGNNPSSLQIMFHFMIAAGFMLASIIVAKSLGAKGAAGAQSYIDKWRAGALGFAGGFIGGTVGRNTIGRLAYKASESNLMKGLAARNPRMGGALKNIADYGSKAGFGSKKGFAKVLDDKTKIPDYIKKDPALLAQYMKGMRVGLPGTSISLAGGLAQQKAYEKLKPEDRVKLAEYRAKGTGDMKTREQITKEIEELDLNNRSTLDWYNGATEEQRRANKPAVEAYDKYMRERQGKLELRKKSPKAKRLEGTRDRVTRAGQVLTKLEQGLPEAERKKLDAALEKKDNAKRQEERLKFVREKIETMKLDPDYQNKAEYQALLREETALIKNKQVPEKPEDKDKPRDDK
ncbi:MAG: hypothetical protein AAB455_00155 [Patescibacteria group bacterium]